MFKEIKVQNNFLVVNLPNKNLTNNNYFRQVLKLKKALKGYYLLPKVVKVNQKFLKIFMKPLRVDNLKQRNNLKYQILRKNRYIILKVKYRI